MKQVVLWLAFLALLVVAAEALSTGRTVNSAFLAVNRDLLQQPGAATLPSQTQVNRLLAQAPDNSRGRRAAGYLAVWGGEPAAAAPAFLAAGWTAAELDLMADHYYAPDMTAQALAWYAPIVAQAPDNREAWQRIGQRCQRAWAAHPVCDDFLRWNDGNRLVDAAFATEGASQWGIIDTAGSLVTVEPCGNGQRCAQIAVTTDVASPPAGIFQCLQLEPGQAYRFSAWIKTEMVDEGQWLPLYVQGNRAGQPDGISFGESRGSREWHWREATFTAPAFDEGLACFSPLRLFNEGRAWLRDPQVREVQP